MRLNKIPECSGTNFIHIAIRIFSIGNQYQFYLQTLFERKV